nr:immunoglobulin light chain junction region [Homo sapiens]
VYYCMQGTHWP